MSEGAPAKQPTEEAVVAPNVPWKVVRDQAAMAVQANPKYHLSVITGKKQAINKGYLLAQMKSRKLSVTEVTDIPVFKVDGLPPFPKLEVVHVVEVRNPCARKRHPPKKLRGRPFHQD